jgi:prepilin-type N-terminal cleavage/methylation domain-containing protein
MQLCADNLRSSTLARRRSAFTLLEMLVVLIIIAIIAALALPNIRGNTESVAINAACRQLVADLSLARQMAIAQRSSVAVVFLPREVFELTLTDYADGKERDEVKRLQGGAFTHYALFQFRRAGEQPGSLENRRYVTEWKSLPDKTFIDPNQFEDTDSFYRNGMKFPFPFSQSLEFPSPGLPYIAFDPDGRCIVLSRSETGAGSVIDAERMFSVIRGAVFFTREGSGEVRDVNFEVQPIPPGNSNIIHIDCLTGRTKRIEPQLQ